ncbi:MAG: hypothetical protein K2O18_16990 [Oscillospiraceae bacterium]|nr:hypothetical protein [Oscillospiraceae bacterium]
MEYSADNGKTWTKTARNMSVSNLLGKTLLFRYADYTSASSTTTLMIPNRGSAPVVVVCNVSSCGRNDGIIMGSTGMEYRKVGMLLPVLMKSVMRLQKPVLLLRPGLYRSMWMETTALPRAVGLAAVLVIPVIPKTPQDLSTVPIQ